MHAGFAGALLFIAQSVTAQSVIAQAVGGPLPPWTPGTLDIHQIQTGRGNATFLIFPDATTLLIDAGGVPDRTGPELAPARPDGSKPPGEWIARYIEQFSPALPATLDYALITHYHDDHMGAIAAVGARIPIRKLIDRGDSPPPNPNPLIDAYRAFRKGLIDKGLAHEVLEPGRADQIVSRAADFEVRNVAANGEVWTGKAWTGQGSASHPVCPAGETLSENELSLALLIRFGRFRYFTGGDIPGVLLDELPACHDLETPVARVIGPVDALLLDHHGWLDTTNAFFLRTLQPRVVVVPAWHATHPDHGVVRRLISTQIYPGPRDLFSTELLEAPRTILSYLGRPFQSTHGHVVIRVAAGGARYTVFILEDGDEKRRILSVHGPYESK